MIRYFLYMLALILFLVCQASTCPIFCGCRYTRVGRDIQYIWHCGYQNLSNNNIDFILNDKNVSDVDQLYLNGNEITTFDSSKLKSFTKLKYLFLDGNLITKLPPTIFNDIPLLEHLSLVNNSINVFSTLTLTDAKKLKLLNLSGNSVHSITNHMFSTLTNLKNLDISRNVIRNLQPGGLLGLQKLERLSLANNKIEEIPTAFFHTLHDIKSLDLSRNQIKIFGKDSLTSLPHLSNVDFSQNLIKKIEIGSFDKSNLLVLNLADNKIERLPNSIFLKSVLNSLNLLNNPLICDCTLKNTVSNLTENDSKNVIKGDCLVNDNAQLSLFNLTSKLDCTFDCNNTSKCKNHGKCNAIQSPSTKTFSYKCNCVNGFHGNLCEMKSKEHKGKTKAVIVLVVVIPIVTIAIGAALFYREWRKRRQRGSDMSPLTDEDFAL